MKRSLATRCEKNTTAQRKSQEMLAGLDPASESLSRKKSWRNGVSSGPLVGGKWHLAELGESVQSTRLQNHGVRVSLWLLSEEVQGTGSQFGYQGDWEGLSGV